ncbi:hypothetical protein HDV03_000132 [Kappamyces sp. JEL0829]|nr:hypothetical protein HDV03_000132 [Kappamyces sp. JEL0829]KAJ3335410.1 hypothetical protein HDU91_002202 [Kappamyces sp. JEL0680]
MLILVTAKKHGKHDGSGKNYIDSDVMQELMQAAFREDLQAASLDVPLFPDPTIAVPAVSSTTNSPFTFSPPTTTAVSAAQSSTSTPSSTSSAAAVSSSVSGSPTPAANAAAAPVPASDQTQSTTSGSTVSGMPVAAIVGASVGSVAVLVAAVYAVRRRKPAKGATIDLEYSVPEPQQPVVISSPNVTASAGSYAPAAAPPPSVFARSYAKQRVAAHRIDLDGFRTNPALAQDRLGSAATEPMDPTQSSSYSVGIPSVVYSESDYAGYLNPTFDQVGIPKP